VSSSDLTASTIRYLFASSWAPPPDSGITMHVPGAEVDGPDTAGNLLNLAIWSLREQELVEVEQLRPVEVERAGGVLGGEPFSRVRPLPGEAIRLGGLEGALLRRARENPEEDTRRLVLQLGIGGGAPWQQVAGVCFREAEAAGLVETKGRVSKKPVIADPAEVEALRERDAEIVAARGKYREEHEELDDAVLADCVHALHWAHSTPND
jgi:hypothetical protein